MNTEIDVICPVYFINFGNFKKNLESWVRELPIKRILFGVNGPKIDFESFKEGIKEFLPDTPFEVIDQSEFKTLGFCIADLMKRVDTEWFAYLHSDVELTANCYSLMKEFIDKDVGIIESERLLYDGKNYIWGKCFFEKRGYSGFQLFQKKVFLKLIKKIDDDYIYRNEDIIFKNVCESLKHKYVKTLAIHIHQTSDNRSFNREETYSMQWKGLIKYATPDEVCLSGCLGAFAVNFHENGYSPKVLLEFASNENKVWEKELINHYMTEIMDFIHGKDTTRL